MNIETTMNATTLRRSLMRRGTQRRGSILIFVVGILVLLALMGTAYVAAVRLDRVQINQIGGAAAQSGGWMTPPAAMVTAEQTLVSTDAVVNPRSIKVQLVDDVIGADGYRLGTGYENFDALGEPEDYWLASRIPEEFPALSGQPAWRVISGNVLDGSDTFASPYIRNSADTVLVGGTMTGRLDWTPSSVTITYGAMNTPKALEGKTRVYPALTPSGGGNRFLAGDTDGDGIADAALVDTGLRFQQPHPQLGAAPIYAPGPTITDPAPNNRVYVAIRVIDNNAVFNLNTAWKLADTSLTAGTVYNRGWFRSNVGMVETFSAAGATAFDLWRNTGLPVNSGGLPYTSVAESLEMEVGRIMTGTKNFRETETPSLVYHCGMIEPGRTLDVETRLQADLQRSAANFAFDEGKRFRFFPADDWDSWFKASFLTTGSRVYKGYDPGAILPKRMNVVTSNPLSTYAPNTGAIPVLPSGSRPWATMPDQSTVQPTKAGINTATFPYLFRTFAQALVANPTAPTVAFAEANFGTGLGNDTERMIVRSALSAVNAEDMRDANTLAINPAEDVITSRKVSLDAVGTRVATVFGSERQPFITKVIRNTANDYTVTLYNPYDDVLNIDGYVFSTQNGATINACTGPAPGGPINSLGTVDYNVTGINGTRLLLQRTRIRGTPAAGNVIVDGVTVDTYNETASRQEWVPVDMVDLSGATADTMEYERSTGDVWNCANASGGFSLPPAVPAAPNKPFPVAMHNTDPDTTRYPFGGFARVADVAMVPYIGTYVVTSGGAIVDIVPVTADVQAWGGGAQIGRFIPTTSTTLGARIFDLFSVTANPNDDRSPNISIGTDLPGNGTTIDATAKPVHGMINLNTASLATLRQLPIMSNAGVLDTTPAAANAIIAARPIASLVDLVGVGGLTPGSFQPEDGYFFPLDLVYAPFQDLQTVGRLSNYATTRSDAYTVYLLIQAWQDADSAAPVLVSEKRTAFILDRSTVNQVNRTTKAMQVSTD